MSELKENERKGRVLTVFVIVNMLLLSLFVGMAMGAHGETSGNLGDIAGWYNDGVDTNSAYLSGSNVYDFDRIAVIKYDLSSIPEGSTLESVVVHLYCNYATVTSGDLWGYQAPHLSGTSYTSGHAFSDSEINTNAPSNSHQLTGSVWSESSWGTISGDADAWQTEFDSYEQMTIGFSGWGYGGTSQSLGIQVTTSYVVVEYTSGGGTWAPTFTSTPIETCDLDVEYDYEVTINETSTFEIVNMPSWLSCEDNNTDITSTHLIGTPTEVGTYPVHLHATSVAGTETAEQDFSIEVNDPDAQVSGTIYPTAIIWHDGGVNYGYISGHDDPWAYDRFFFMKFDLSSIGSGATIYDVELNIWTESSNFPIAVNATGAFTGNGSGYSFSEAQLASLSPAGSRAFQIDGTLGGHGMISTWQTQYDNNQTIYIGLSAWDWSGTITSDLIATFLNDGQERTPRIVVTYHPGSTPGPTTWAPTITSGIAPSTGWLGTPYKYSATANESVNWSVSTSYGTTSLSYVYLDTDADIAGNAGIVKHGAATYWECANWYNYPSAYLTKSGTSANAQFSFGDLTGLGTINSVSSVWVIAQAYVNTGSGWQWVGISKQYTLNPVTGTVWNESSVNSISGYFKSSATLGWERLGIYVGSDMVPAFLDQGATNGLRGMYLLAAVNHTTAVSIATVSAAGEVLLYAPAAGSYTIYLTAQSVAGTLDAWYNWTVTIAIPWGPTLENTPDATAVNHAEYKFYYQYNESINALFIEADWNGAGTWDVSIGYGMDLSGSFIEFIPDGAGVYDIKMTAWSTDGAGSTLTEWNVTVTAAWNPTVTSHPSQLTYVSFTWSYTWVTNETCTLVSASIPAWVTYNAGTHTWSGSSLANGTWAFSATFLSSVEGGVVTQYWNVTVQNLPVPVITSTPATTAYAGDRYSYTVVASSATITVTLTEKPSWASVSSKTVGGIAREGRFTFEVFVYDTYWHTNTTQTWDVTVYPASAADYSSSLGGGMWAFVVPLVLLFVIAILCCVSREGISGASFLGSLVIGTVVLAWGGAFGPNYLPYVAIAGVVLALMLFRAYREAV